MKKYLPYIILFIGLMVLAWYLDKKSKQTDCTFHFHTDATDLILTEHAKCRMRCREIDRTILDDTYMHGELNCEKSGERDGSFRYAVDKRDRSGDMIRIILVEENNHHKVITAIRLDREDKCECD